MNNTSARGLRRTVYCVAGVVQIATLLCAFEKPAYAYVDPGSGYVLFQIVGSMLAGAAFFVRHRLRRMFGWAVDGDSSSTGQASAPTREER
jgi:hypothetical protein